MNRRRALYAYIAAVTGLAVALLGYCGFSIYRVPPTDPWQLSDIVILSALYIVFSSQRVYYSESSAIMLGTVGQIAVALVLPWQLAMPVVGLAKAGIGLRLLHKGQWRLIHVCINSSNSALAAGAAAVAFDLLHGGGYLWSVHSIRPLFAFPALVAAGVAYYATDTLVVSGAIAFNSTDTLLTVIGRTWKDTIIPDWSLIIVGIILAILFHFSPVLSLLVIVPIYLCAHAFAAVARLRDETEKAVLHLAQSVDVRDTGTGVHSQQLEAAAQRLSRALGLTPEHVHEIGMAARAHDLGKIEIPDAILLKRGPLTPEERRVMEEHPVIGETMLASYSAFAKSVPYVRHHHERWDGRGYPDGLKGEEIPLGARIIAVVDAYDAMTADRPYRKALSVDEAVSRLKEGMGTQFDPKICAAWIQLLIEDRTYVPHDNTPYLQIVQPEAS